MAKSEIEQKDIKAKNLGAVCKIEVDDAGTPKIIYFKKPHRYTIGLYYAKRESNKIEAIEFLFKQTALSEVSDMEILSAERDDLFYAAIGEVDTLLNVVEVKKSKSQTL
jgi:hypothetical protein